MTDHADVVRDEASLVAGLTALDEIETRTADIGVHIDIGSFSDLAHAYDLRSAVPPPGQPSSALGSGSVPGAATTGPTAPAPRPP